MLDCDLAIIYGYKVKALNQQGICSRSQIVTLKRFESRFRTGVRGM